MLKSFFLKTKFFANIIYKNYTRRTGLSVFIPTAYFATSAFARAEIDTYISELHKEVNKKQAMRM